jgi:hypothetical protein
MRDARREIEGRKADKARQAREATLIDYGMAAIPSYLIKLKYKSEISDEDSWDGDFSADPKESVRNKIEAQLSVDGTARHVEMLPRETAGDQLW